jgi:predicted nucleotide-binding protein
MKNWNETEVVSILKQEGWYAVERTIEYGKQFELTDGTKVNWYQTGRVQVQGKQSEIKTAAKHRFEGAGTPLPQQEPPTSAVETALSRAVSPPTRVFIVYGHDTSARDQLELLLRRLKLEPIILQNVAGGGDTIIEKLEELTESDFACVLLTPDDMGRKRAEANTELKPRARQNVVLELGMVLAKLGRPRVGILVKGNDIERPSDIDGLIYIPFTDDVDELKNTLAMNLQNAGFEIKLENLLT